MNALMRRIQRVSISLLIAILTAGIVTIAGMAGGPYNRSEGGNTSGNLWQYYGPLTISTISSSACLDTYCGRLPQAVSSSNDTYYAWNMGSSNVTNIYDWCAWTPSIANAGVRYDIWEKSQSYYWYVLVNTANHHGQYVYLGFSDYPNIGDASKFPLERNQCQAGYACDGRYVYWDRIRYTTYPTRNQSCQ